MHRLSRISWVLQDRGSRGLCLERVYRLLYDPELHLASYGKIYRNFGAMTRGATSETADGMSLAKIHQIIEALRHDRFEWTPVRRIYIPKKNGKLRPLGLPTWSDKLVQESIRVILEAYYEPQFSDHSFGFRPNRGCQSALTRIARTWTGTSWFIEGDISGCFDNIDHTVLLGILRDRIRDGRFVNLVAKLLRAGYLEEWSYKPTLSGSPQGGIVKARWARKRRMAKIPLELPNGRQITLSPGGQNVLVAKIIHEFCPRFVPGGQPVYVGDTESKHAFFDSQLLDQLGIRLDAHGKMPDIVVYHAVKNWLVLIEAVTSHGPVDSKRRDELKALFSGSKAPPVFVTAFLNRKAMMKYLNEISWETEVWVADAPSHMIHFNGERFLGPYDD